MPPPASRREAYQRKAGDAFVEKHADRMADRQAEISDKALDAIDEAITQFRSDLAGLNLETRLSIVRTLSRRAHRRVST